MTFDERMPFLSSRLLHLILMPTEQCNLRCVYCYEDFAAGKMPVSVVEAVKALLESRIAALDLLSLEWFGGEPLLAWDIVENIQSFACELIRQHPGVRLVGTMVTNGVLLNRRRLERLLALDIRRFQISLDGTQETHDTTRIARGSDGSFAAIWRNLLHMRTVSDPFDVLLRLHVTRLNQAAVEKLLVDLAHEIGGDRRFSVMLKAVRRFGGPRDSTLPILLPVEEEEVLGHLYALAAELGLSFCREVFAQPGMLPGCYAAALGSYVVRSNGELAKCSINLDHPNNRIGALLPDGTVALDSAKMVGWLRGVLNGDPESVECPSKGWSDDRLPQGASSVDLVQIGRR